MSANRLSDERITEIQRASDDDWIDSLDDALSWADLDSLLDEVREARKRIAELERDRDKWEAAFGDAEDMVFEARRERDHYRIACGDADDEVREARARIEELEHANREMRQALESGEEDSAESEHVAHLQRKIAELEAIIDAREAQLVEMRERILRIAADDELDADECEHEMMLALDEFAIPTTPPEKKTHTRRIATLEWREASPPPPAVDPREEDDA